MGHIVSHRTYIWVRFKKNTGPFSERDPALLQCSGAFGTANEAILTEIQSWVHDTSPLSEMQATSARTFRRGHPTHFRAPLRHEGRDPETMGACRMTRVKTCMARTARSWPT